MTGMRSELAAFIESAGAHVCRSAELTVKGIAGVIGAAVSRIKRSLAPVAGDTSKFLKSKAKKSALFIISFRENTAESVASFKRRVKIFGVKRAAVMQWRERRLAAKRKGIGAGTVFNVMFPAASVMALVMTVNSVMSTDYGVAVEYDGEEIGVVSGEDVLSEAQCVVADRIKYYDTDGDYYVTAALTIKPLSLNENVMDETTLAEKIEDKISMKYDEKPLDELMPSQAQEEESEQLGDKVKAYAVRVNGELIGAVEDYSEIENALEAIKEPYDNGEYTEIGFDKDVEYDLEEYFEPDQIVSENVILETLTGYEDAPEYYEVQPGDNLWKIAESKDMTLKELAGCYATYNGAVIEDIEHSVLKVGTLIQLDSEVPYLQVECRKEVTIRNELEYETITIEDVNLPVGEVVVDVEGENGEKRSRAIVTYREGTAVRKKTLDSVIYREPVSEIVRVGIGVRGINYDVPEFISDGGTGNYFWPVDGGYISSHQGDGRGHKGIDIAAPYGTPIYAAAGGTVIDASSGGAWNGGYGNSIVIENEDGNVTVYAHQSEIAAEVGDVIEQGQLIGYVGNTGDSNGNHLHFEIRQDGKYYDPELFVVQP